MTAKNAELVRTSHYVNGDGSHTDADGISKEEVFLYFTATWRGKLVDVTMSADRYCASFHDSETGSSTNRLTDWRVYATSETRYHDETKNGCRGEYVTGTARSALGELCEPLAMEWLKSDAYTVSFQAAAARMIMRLFRDDYWAVRNVRQSLATFKGRLAPAVLKAISSALKAREAYEAAKTNAEQIISGEVER